MRHLRFASTVAASAAVLLALAGCTMHEQEAPPLSGPSEYGTSIAISIAPDVLTQDGASQSLITVTAGTVTAYDGDDPSCTPHEYTPGMGFVDPGGDHVHVLRNEGLDEARTITVQLLPAGATRRIDADDPGVCPF